MEHTQCQPFGMVLCFRSPRCITVIDFALSLMRGRLSSAVVVVPALAPVPVGVLVVFGVGMAFSNARADAVPGTRWVKAFFTTSFKPFVVFILFCAAIQQMELILVAC